MSHRGRFITPLDARHLGPMRKQLLRELVYVAADGAGYVVEPGFVSDGASVPRFLWWRYPPFGEAYEPATWLHDKLYRDAEAFPGMTRAKADALMAEASAGCGYSRRGRTLMHAGLWLGGWLTWRRHRAAAAVRLELAA